MDEEEYFIPLQDQRVFGAGIKRKRVNFVHPEKPSTSTPPQSSPTGTSSDLYLSIVFNRPDPSATNDLPSPSTPENSTQTFCPEASSTPLCTICSLPLQVPSTSTHPHEASLAHQVCLAHSYPPSYLDRTRPGFKYLTSYGWDPDSRLGLGATGAGIRVPIKGKVKNDTVGLGVEFGKKGKKVIDKKVEKLDAKKVRKMDEVGRRKGERLREMFYRNDDVERYLGGEI